MLVKQVCFADTVVFAGMCKHVALQFGISVNKLLKIDRNTYFAHISGLTNFETWLLIM